MKFTTKDKDNGQGKWENSAVNYKGGWWYKHCDNSNLNDLYFQGETTSAQGMHWYHWKNGNTTMKKTEMKMRLAEF
jgi:ficolin